MLSRILKQYYEPLRIPAWHETISDEPYTHHSVVYATTMTGLPSCTINLPLHAAPATPVENMERVRYLTPYSLAFSIWPQDRLPQLKWRSYIWVHLRYGLQFCPWETYNPWLLIRCFPALLRHTD